MTSHYFYHTDYRTGQIRKLVEICINGDEKARQEAYHKLKAKPSTSRLLLVSGAPLTKEQKDELAENAYKLAKLYAPGLYGSLYAGMILHYHPEASEDLKERCKELQVRHERYLIKIRKKLRKSEIETAQ